MSIQLNYRVQKIGKRNYAQQNGEEIIITNVSLFTSEAIFAGSPFNYGRQICLLQELV